MLCASCRAPNDDTAESCSGCGRALAPLASGTVLAGRYEIQALLGRGGMGVVYRARDRKLDEPVALKVLRGELAASPELEQRFLSEIKLARRVSHWNVCRIHDYSEQGNVRCLSMELVEGTDLKRLLKQRGTPPLDEAFEIAIQAAEGLQAIHKVGVVHRDLKPSNIMVDAGGRVRLMDFGIAKRLAWEAGGGETGSGYVVGTPEYMSPEQARGRALDARSDVYSLGIVLFELFTGRVPFADTTPVATILRQIEETPPLGEEAPAGIPEALVPVLRRALAKRPDERFATAQELADALRRARDAGERLTTADIAPRRLGPRAVRRGAVLAAAIAFAAWVASRSQEAPPTASPPVDPLASPPTATTPTATALEPSPPPRVRRLIAASRPDPTPSPEVAPAVAALEPATTPPPAAAPADPLPPPSATPSPAPTTGLLQLAVTPWAEVAIDGVPAGQTPLPRLALSAGPHLVVLTFQDRELRRKLTIRAGETLKLEADMRTDAVRRSR